QGGLGPVEKPVQGQRRPEDFRLALRADCWKHLGARKHLRQQLQEWVFSRSFDLPDLYIHPRPSLPSDPVLPARHGVQRSIGAIPSVATPRTQSDAALSQTAKKWPREVSEGLRQAGEDRAESQHLVGVALGVRNRALAQQSGQPLVVGDQGLA